MDHAEPQQPSATHEPPAPLPQEAPGSPLRTALDPAIAALDLAPVCFLAVYTYHWDLAKVRAMELEYRCWLQCVLDFPGDSVVPGRDCDLFWHCHILYLEGYLKQTTALFGRPLLHDPFAGLLGDADEARQNARFEHGQQRVQALLSRLGGGN
jgi:hypothetical protein